MADVRTLSSIPYKTRNLALGSQVQHGFSGLKTKCKGLHLVGVEGHTLISTLKLPACWTKVGGSNGGRRHLEFYTI